MEGLKRPVGDLPPEVYWRRRLVAGAFAVLALLVLYYLVRSLFASGDGTEAAPSTSTSTTVSSTATVDVASTPGSTVDLSSVRACGAADVTIILTATTHDWAGSTEPTFDGTVSQVASTPCVLDTSDEKAELLVTSGNVRQWSNLDCDSGALLAPKEILLDPGETAVVSVTWPRVRSADGCPTGLPAPGPGTYRATLTVQGIESDQAVFALRN